MKDIKDGGPAFPEVCNNQIIPGMSLRDYFAGQALTGAMSNPNVLATNKLIEDGELRDFCYRVSDTMLKERES